MLVDHERKRQIPELFEIERLIDKLRAVQRAKSRHFELRIEQLTEVPCGNHRFPVHAIVLGPNDPTTPIFGLFGGVHGLEKIGTQLVISYLKTLVELLSWDNLIHDYLGKARLAFVPLVNPGGMFLRRRSNPEGVDLMRNAPVEAEHLAKFKPLSGHRISPILPWYRGEAGLPMQRESRAVCDFVQREFFPSKMALSLDVHSGFGVRDRLWFPYAKSRKPIHDLPELYALLQLFEMTFPNNVYKIEPQSQSYTTHGDLWDYLYDEYRGVHAAAEDALYLPFSLELGSWIWVKKNPKQLLSLIGAFNPMVHHRYRRTMRRHIVLLDFLQRAVLAHGSWRPQDKATRQRYKRAAFSAWYAHHSKSDFPAPT